MVPNIQKEKRMSGEGETKPRVKGFIGIDPGKSGGLAYFTKGSDAPDLFIPYTELVDPKTRDAKLDVLRCIASLHNSEAYIENVSASPQMGVSSSFNFGHNAGFWEGMLYALGIKVTKVTPVTWQSALGCRTQGGKNVTKNKAKLLFPEWDKAHRVTHTNADAILIAYYHMVAKF